MTTPRGSLTRVRLDGRGRTLLALSGVVPAVLLASSVAFAMWGAQYFWEHPGDPLGLAATTFSSTVLTFFLFGIASLGMMLAYAGWYRAALRGDDDPDVVVAHWVGAMFILVALPYFAFGLFYYRDLAGRLLLWGSLLAFVFGVVYYHSPRIWKRPTRPIRAPRGTR